MFRMVNRIGLFLVMAILILFVGAKVINARDPYRALTEALVAEIAADPQRTTRLNTYGAEANALRQTLNTEQAAAIAAWLDATQAVPFLESVPGIGKVKVLAVGVDTAVHKIAAFDANLAAITSAATLSQRFAQLRSYDLEHGNVTLTDLYQQSQTVSHSLNDVSEGLGTVATAVEAVTEQPALETFQQEALEWRSHLNIWLSEDMANKASDLIDLVYWSIESWQGVPANMLDVKQRMDMDAAWLNHFEQRYEQATIINERWHFDTLRLLPLFVAENSHTLYLGIVGGLLLALAGWLGSRERRPAPQVHAPRRQVVAQQAPLRPSLAFQWENGRTERQTLPTVGELTIGNIVIKRARVRYYLERLDNAFPAFLNGQPICGARILNDGDMLQIGELHTVFQLVA